MRIFILSLATVALFACPSPPGGGPSGADAGSSGGGDGGSQVIGVGCTSDDDCGQGTRCDIASGDCVAGVDCTGNPGVCAFCDTNDCGFSGSGYCDAEAGVCRETRPTCASCSDDDQCGISATTGLENRCHEGHCADGCGACPAGFQCLSGGCVPAPAAGTCEDAILCGDGTACPDGQLCSDLGVCLFICNVDADCDAGDVCVTEAGPLLGQCIAGCPFGETVVSNGVTLICHADGRFGLPCETPDTTTGCPPGTECQVSGACGLSGCQDSGDCPLPRTYCDTNTGACVDGCGDAADCGAFEECVDNVCVAGGCRGKDVSCNMGEWCCGTEYYEDASTCPSGTNEGDCFLTPEPWCRVCNEDADCADLEASFGYPSFCYELQSEDDQGNTEVIGKFCSVGCESNLDCPRGVACQLELPTAEGGTTQGCMDARCGPISAARGDP